MNSAVASPRKAMPIVVLTLKILFALLFLAAAGAKIFGVPALVAEFDQVGLGQWFRYATALLELSGAVLLLIPRLALYGAVLLAVVCVGALIAQIAAIHQDWIHCVVMAALLVFVAYQCRGAARGLAGDD